MNCAIIIPEYKEKLCDSEELSLLRALHVFQKRDIKIVIPNNIKTNYYDRLKMAFDFEYVKVNPKWLSSLNEYNQMCMYPDFYLLFEKYDYILIYQTTDCWVFEDNIDYFMNLDFDWYGAAWPNYGDKVGNGGFSLRKTKKMLELTKKYESDKKTEHEDTWFCLTHGNEIKSCDLKTAVNFSIELHSPKYNKLIDTHPMGVHGNFNRHSWGKPNDNIW